MKSVSKKIGILAVLGAVLVGQGCGIIERDECDEEAPPSRTMALNLSSYGKATVPAAPPRPLPAIVPTAETYAGCAVMQEELRADWANHRSYDVGRYENMPRPVRMSRGSRSAPPPATGTGPIEKALKGCGTTFSSGSSGGSSGRMASKKANSATEESAPVSADYSDGGDSDYANGAAGGSSGPIQLPEQAASDAGSGVAPGSGSTFTNTQEKGVDEPDVVKIGANHLYIEREGELIVVQRSTLQPIGNMPLPKLEGITLYADGDTLLIVGGAHEKDGYLTRVQIYRGTDGALPVLAKEHTFDGQAYDSRYIGSRLVLVFRDQLPWNPTSADPAALPIKVENDAVKGVPCDRILKPAVHDLDTRFVKVVSVNAATVDEAPRFAAAIGGGDQIYMTAETLYLTKQGVQWDSYNPEANETLLVTRVDFAGETGELKVAAAGTILGRVKDQWAFKEHRIAGGEKVLSVATSTGQLWSYGSDIAQNHVWVLRQKETTLEVVASIRDFGTGEDIRSVRYVNDMAYVVTFKKTDPLFAIDMKDPLAPKMLGELKIPGFSVYMHPVADGRLLGVGFDADDKGDFAYYQGLQISLFDVFNPMDLKRLDVEIVGERGSSSEVTGDHHAFFFDPGLKLVGLPVVELAGKSGTGGSELANELKFSGALLYFVEDTELVEAGRITHREMMPKVCDEYIAQPHWWQDKVRALDVNRIFLIDGKLLTVSRFGLMAHDPNALTAPPLVQAAFAGGESLCPVIERRLTYVGD